MLITNHDNFEIFGSPYYLLDVDLLFINNPPIYAFSAKYLHSLLYSPFLFGAIE